MQNLALQSGIKAGALENEPEQQQHRLYCHIGLPGGDRKGFEVFERRFEVLGNLVSGFTGVSIRHPTRVFPRDGSRIVHSWSLMAGVIVVPRFFSQKKLEPVKEGPGPAVVGDQDLGRFGVQEVEQLSDTIADPNSKTQDIRSLKLV